MAKNKFHTLLRETGLLSCPQFYRDAQFYLALLAGLIILIVIHFFFPVKSEFSIQQQWGLLLTLVLWQPFIEEWLFRGIIQGQILKLSWGPRTQLKISLANLITSLTFVLTHLVYHPSSWAVAIFFPSLVFGYFRERHNSIYSAFTLHGLYNLGYLVIISL